MYICIYFRQFASWLKPHSEAFIAKVVMSQLGIIKMPDYLALLISPKKISDDKVFFEKTLPVQTNKHIQYAHTLE